MVNLSSSVVGFSLADNKSIERDLRRRRERSDIYVSFLPMVTSFQPESD